MSMSEERIKELAATLRNPRRWQVEELLRRAVDEACTPSSETTATKEALLVANDILRSCYAVAERMALQHGQSFGTNWNALHDQIGKALDQQLEILRADLEARARASAAPEVSAQGASEGEPGLMCDGPHTPSATAAAHGSDKRRWEWPVNTVGKLIASLQTLPPSMPFYTAYFVEIDGERVTRCKNPSLSLETTDGFRVMKFDEKDKSLVMWASQERSCAPSASDVWKPTHGHAAGGTYQKLGYGKAKMNDGWEAAVFYKEESGALYATTMQRWDERFVPLVAVPDRGADQK